ncbi:hypothetical protein EVG20_g9581 [Dentipellis fragilis]|uniref:PQ-loop-domain-containing protein n=1 Tax=Dentipellis fragilis TaxID=205917 RepID=A0A4Y9XYK6_9AGAM|nr:hypothetical protein EVG20_g9581 [Dentipellis fragilis]
MPVNRAAENALGTLGTVCWTVQLVPQIWKSWRTKSTDGLSHWLVLVWAVSAVPLGTYAIVQNLNIPLILQPQLFGTLALVSWGQCMYYDHRRPLRQCLIMVFSLYIVMAALETGFVFAVRPSYRRGEESGERGVQFFGILASVMIALALLPQYYEIYKHRAVVGISISFMSIDLLGGVFSDLSLVFKEKFDVIAAVTYSLVILMDGLVILAALILNPIAKRRARRRQEASMADTPIASETTVVVSGRGQEDGKAQPIGGADAEKAA